MKNKYSSKINSNSIRRALSVGVCLLLASQSMAELPMAPLSNDFLPEGRTAKDLQEYAKPNTMTSILPGRPVAAHDKDGSRVYYSPGGKLMLQVSPDGKMTFSLKGKSKEYDMDGNLVKTTEAERGTNMEVVKNEKGEVLGYKEKGFGGKTVKEYDADNNLTKSYQYNEYGKSIEWVMDELSQTKTVFDADGQMVRDVDFEGNTIATYQYDDQKQLVSKKDGFGNVTSFDKHGNMTGTADFLGNEVSKYNYSTDDNGRYVLDTIVNLKNNETTYIVDGKQTETKSQGGAVVKDYMWDGSKLVCTFDREKKETTWYDLTGRPTYTSVTDDATGEVIDVTQWLYYKGRLVGVWDQTTKTTLICEFQREAVKIYTGAEPPSAEQIQKWVDDGIITSVRKQGL